MSDSDEPKATIEEIDEAEKASRRYAPLLIVRGVIGIIAGIVLLFWPGAGLAVVAVVLGIFLIADGIERLVTVLKYPVANRRYDAWSLVGSILRIILGAVVLFNPVDAGGVWVSIIFVIAGFNLVFSSLLMMWKDSSLKDDPLSAGITILTFILGLLMIIMPLVSATFLLRLLGAVLVLAAVPSLAIGLRSRSN